MPTTRTLPAVFAALGLLVSCGSDNGVGDRTTSTVTPITTVAPTTAVAAETSTGPATTIEKTTTEKTTTTTSGVITLEQPAIWPAADVVFDTPELAAGDFVTRVLGVDPVLGPFQQGDARSGEMEVFSPGEGGAAARVGRGLLLLRQLGPADGWFIIGAVNDFASITSPASMTAVPAGPLTVEGVARGFEANVVVEAFLAGDAKVLDQQITMGGAMETPEPYRVTLDLSGTTPGDVVMVIVRGGTGLETDPGEFGAIPVVIAG